MALKTYDVAKILVIFGGVPLRGFAPGTKISITYPEAFNKVVGTDAEVARGKTNDETCLATLEILQTSKTNDTLSSFHLADKAAPAGVPLPFFLKNLNGTTLITAAGAWVKGFPSEVAYGTEAAANRWVIDMGETLTFIGGQDAAV